MKGYESLILENLKKVFKKSDSEIKIKAFGCDCVIKPDGIFLSGKKETGAIGVIISLYAQNHFEREPVFEPFISIKDIPDSKPYYSAFHEYAERPLIPYVDKIYEKRELIQNRLGHFEKGLLFEDSGDFSFVLFPLPKIALKYIFYFADEEFPASVTCLFSNNAPSFLPTDVLSDLAEYTGKKILELIKE